MTERIMERARDLAEGWSTQTSTPTNSVGNQIPIHLAPYMDMPIGRDVFLKLSPDDPFYTFIPCNSMINQKEDKKLMIAKV